MREFHKKKMLHQSWWITKLVRYKLFKEIIRFICPLVNNKRTDEDFFPFAPLMEQRMGRLGIISLWLRTFGFEYYLSRNTGELENPKNLWGKARAKVNVCPSISVHLSVCYHCTTQRLYQSWRGVEVFMYRFIKKLYGRDRFQR